MNRPHHAPASQLPLVTVVVATRSRANLLARLLDALADQDYRGVEICVVDDASEDATSTLLAAWEGLGRTVIRRDTPGGSYAARNHGWRASRGTIVAFTDDDCVPAPTWISSLVAALCAPGTVGVQGVTLAEPGPTTPFTHQIDQRRPGTPYRTCNIAYTRLVLEELDGFDERFHSYGDTLFGLRARERGLIAFAPDAIVLHPPRPREWHTRMWWDSRLRDDLAFRGYARTLGMLPAETGEVDPFMASRRVRSDIRWVVRPIRTKLIVHTRFFMRHPLRYLRQAPDMVRDRWAMIGALRAFWLDRSRSQEIA